MFSRTILSFVILACLLGVTTAQANSLPPEIVELFEQIGIPIDEDGTPIPSPAPPQPAPPAEPISSPEELFAQLGIPFPGEPVDPPTPTTPPKTLTPEELAELLGIPAELLIQPPTPPVTIDEPTEVVPPPVTSPPEFPPELIDILGFNPFESTPEPDTVVPPPTEPVITTPEELAQMLGLPVELFVPAESPSNLQLISTAQAVPEPTALAITTLCFLLLYGAHSSRRAHLSTNRCQS